MGGMPMPPATTRQRFAVSAAPQPWPPGPSTVERVPGRIWERRSVPSPTIAYQMSTVPASGSVAANDRGTRSSEKALPGTATLTNWPGLSARASAGACMRSAQTPRARGSFDTTVKSCTRAGLGVGMGFLSMWGPRAGHRRAEQ